MGKQAEAAVERARKSRGYLLPHHRLLSLVSPELLAGYDDLYSRINLPIDDVAAHEQEYLWLVILASIRSSTAAHHISRFVAAGGTLDEIQHALRIAALPATYEAAMFAHANWRTAIPDFDWRVAYRAAVPDLPTASTLLPEVVEVACALAQACGKKPQALRLHLSAALNEGISERALVRFLALLIFPAGLPTFVSAAWIWRNLILEGDVPASDAFLKWAQAYKSESGAKGASIAKDI